MIILNTMNVMNKMNIMNIKNIMKTMLNIINRDILNIMNIMNIMKILNIMKIMKIMKLMNIMNIMNNINTNRILNILRNMIIMKLWHNDCYFLKMAWNGWNRSWFGPCRPFLSTSMLRLMGKSNVGAFPIAPMTGEHDWLNDSLTHLFTLSLAHSLIKPYSSSLERRNYIPSE